MKRILSFLMVATLLLIGNAYATQRTATFGDFNASNVYRLRADMDSSTTNCAANTTCGWLVFAQDTGIYWPYISTATTNTTLVPAQSGTTLIFGNGAGTAANGTTYTLPVAAVGMEYSFISDVAKYFRIDANVADTFQYSTAIAGSSLSNVGSALAGDNISVFCATAGKWSIKSKTGTWTVDNNP